jgi:hypothetical protein
MPNLSISFVWVYVEDRKKLEAKKWFLNFLCREFFVWLLVKKSLTNVFFVPRAFCLALGEEVCLPSDFLNFICREFFIWLSAQNQTLGKDWNSGSGKWPGASEGLSCLVEVELLLISILDRTWFSRKLFDRIAGRWIRQRITLKILPITPRVIHTLSTFCHSEVQYYDRVIKKAEYPPHPVLNIWRFDK